MGEFYRVVIEHKGSVHCIYCYDEKNQRSDLFNLMLGLILFVILTIVEGKNILSLFWYEVDAYITSISNESFLHESSFTTSGLQFKKAGDSIPIRINPDDYSDINPGLVNWVFLVIVSLISLVLMIAGIHGMCSNRLKSMKTFY